MSETCPYPEHGAHRSPGVREATRALTVTPSLGEQYTEYVCAACAYSLAGIARNADARVVDVRVLRPVTA